MLYLRNVKSEDMLLIFDWANDPVVRKNAFNTDYIELSTHEKWFAARLNDEETRIYVLMREDTPLGQVRVQRDTDDYVIDYSVADRYRGKGYGVKLLELMEKKVVKDFGNMISLVGKVKALNVASCRVFEHLGYAGTWNEKECCMTYKKVLS